jgi:hypothetical protein
MEYQEAGCGMQEAVAGSWFMVVEAGMEARGWMLEKMVYSYGLYPASSI